MRKKINHRIRYSEKDFVEKNYMKDGKAVIPIKINKLDDLYMKNDYLKLDLSDHVFDYIEEQRITITAPKKEQWPGDYKCNTISLLIGV